MLEDKFIYNEVNFRNINKSNVFRKFAREIFANIREATVSEQKNIQYNIDNISIPTGFKFYERIR